MQYADSHSHRRPGVWQATDCLVACESGAFVISSPNMAVIPEPHVGTADVHWEADGYFGCHDPARWPQLFDQDDSYRWMTAVRMRPSSASDAMAPMWRALVVEGVDADVQCVPGADLYTVCAAILEPLARLVKQATARVCAFKDARGKSSMLHDLEEHMTFALRSLSYPSSKRDLVRGLADLQRHWLLLDAWLEWHVHLFDNGEKAYQDPHHKRQDTAIARSDLLGAFDRHLVRPQAFHAEDPRLAGAYQCAHHGHDSRQGGPSSVDFEEVQIAWPWSVRAATGVQRTPRAVQDHSDHSTWAHGH